MDKRPGHRPGLIYDPELGAERPYDPYLDADVPAAWFGPLPADITDAPMPDLRPERDLPRAAAEKEDAA